MALDSQHLPAPFIQSSEAACEEVTASDVVSSGEPAEPEMPSSQRRRVFLVMCVQQLISQMGFGILAPLYPHEARDKSVKSSTVGWVFGVFQLVNVLGTPVFLKLIPKIGPTNLLNTCAFVDGVATIAFALTWYVEDTLWFVVLCFASRIVSAVAVGITGIVGYGLIPILLPGNLSTGSAIVETCIGVSWMFAPVLASVLYTLVGGDQHLGNVVPYLFVGLLNITFGLFTVLYYPKLPVPDAQQAGIRNFSPRVAMPSVICLVCASAMEYPGPVLQPYLAEAPFNFSIGGVGVVFAVWSLLYIIVGPLVGMLDDKTAGRYSEAIMLGGLLTMALGYLFLAPAGVMSEVFHIEQSVPNMWIGVNLAGIGSSLGVIPTYNAIFKHARHQDEDSQANATSALYNIMYCGGAFLGPMAAGNLSNIFGLGASFTWFALFLAGLSFLLIILTPFLQHRFARTIQINEASGCSQGDLALDLTSESTEASAQN